MEIIDWDENINTKFYSFSKKPVENTKMTEFMSGRRIGSQINTKKLMFFTCKLRLTKAEEDLFWTWFNDELGQTVNCFTCPALSSNYLQFVSIPEPDGTDQKWTTLNLEIQEVF